MNYNRKRRSELKLKEKNPRWNGGRTIDAHGYVRLLVGNHVYKKEHRLVMEQYLGRSLKPTEVVHHKNGIKHDNRIENLEVLENQSVHRQVHKQGRVVACMTCGKEKYRSKSQIRKHVFCSKKCNRPEIWVHGKEPRINAMLRT